MRSIALSIFVILALSTASFAGQIGITWDPNPPVEEVLGYRVFRCTGSACTPTVQVGTDVTTGTTFIDTGVATGIDYTYGVKAYNITGVSALSATVTGSFVPGLPTAPGNVRRIP